MVMSNLEFDWGQPPVGEDIYFSDRSIGGSVLMQSASRVRGTSHRSCGTRSRALTRGRVTSKTKGPRNLPSLVLRRESPLGDSTAAVNGKLQGEGALGCSGLNPGRGDGPHRPIEILLPRTVNESIG